MDYRPLFYAIMSFVAAIGLFVFAWGLRYRHAMWLYNMKRKAQRLFWVGGALFVSSVVAILVMAFCERG